KRAYIDKCWVPVSASSEWFVSGAYADNIEPRLIVPRMKRGPKAIYDWPAGREFVFGDFKKVGIVSWDDFLSEYKTKSELVDQVRQFYIDRSKDGEEGVPGDTQLKEMVNLWLGELVGNS